MGLRSVIGGMGCDLLKGWMEWMDGWVCTRYFHLCLFSFRFARTITVSYLVQEAFIQLIDLSNIIL